MQIAFLMLGYTRTREETRVAAPLDRLLDQLVTQGFRLGAETEDQAYKFWLRATGQTSQQEQSDPSEIAQREQSLRPGQSLDLKHERERFLRGQSEEFSCMALSTARTGVMHGVDFHFSLSAEEGIMFASISDREFTQRDGDHPALENNALRSTWWINLLRVMYDQWLPLFFFEHTGYEPFTERDQALALAPQMLYRVCFFGPELVAQLGGLAYVLAAPAWRVEEMSDGGVMLVAAPYAVDSNYHQKAVADYLGLPMMYPPQLTGPYDRYMPGKQTPLTDQAPEE